MAYEVEGTPELIARDRAAGDTQDTAHVVRRLYRKVGTVF